MQWRLLKGCLVDIRQSPGFSPLEGTNMLEKVHEAKLPEWMRQDISKCIQEMVMSSVQEPQTGGKKKRVCMQRNLHIYNYFTAGEWETLKSQRHTIGTKLALLSKRCALLGLTSPSEPTYVMCIAILVLASHQECADEFTYEVSNGFGILSDFKHVLKNVCKGVTHSGLQVYPDDPAKLPDEIKKHAYQEGTPAKCPLDIMTLQRLCNDLPARRTHTAVSGGNKGRTSTRDESFKTWFADMLMRGMANGHGKQYNALPGFMMLDHKQTKTGKAPQLALEDGDEETQEEQQPKVIPAQAKAIDAMAAMIGDQLAQNKNNKKQKKAEDCDDEPKAKKQKNSTEEKKPETETTLSFPGIKKRDPMRSGVAVIYTCPNSSSWRVKKEGEKKDKSFSWKGKPAKEVWPRVVDYVRKLK